MTKVYVLVDQFDNNDSVSVHTTFDGLKAKMIGAIDTLEPSAEIDRALHTINSMDESMAQIGFWISYEEDTSYLNVYYVELEA